ncbi:MAG TPA: hypothetical protein VHE09_17175 [Rhizomicrobium sp.]|nr:hypothetical protein [Rhizomicrobium sp.]
MTRNNLHSLDATFPLGCLTAVTRISGSGKSSLVSQALPELVSERLWRPLATMLLAALLSRSRAERSARSSRHPKT